MSALDAVPPSTTRAAWTAQRWLLAALALVACQKEPAPSSAPAVSPAVAAAIANGPEPGHVANYVFERPKSLNPFCTTSPVARKYVHGFTHDALLDLDPRTGALRGALASEWQVDASGMELWFTLRDGVQFADGSPCTAQDVLWTFVVAQAQDVVLGQIAAGMNLVASAELTSGAPNRLHIRLRTRHHDALRLVGTSWLVGQQSYFVARIAELAKQQGIAAPAPDQPGFGTLLAQVLDQGPGTGAYVLPMGKDGRADWERELRLDRNVHSWARAQRADSWNFAGIRIRYLADPAAQFAALRDRSLDFYQLPDLDQVLSRDAGIARDYRKVVYDLSYLSIYLVQWNLRRPQLQDVRVRQALSLLLDRQAIAASLLHGNASVALAYAMPSSKDYPRDLPVPRLDPAAARRLLREAGYDPAAGKPLRITIVAPAENPLYRQILELAADAAQQAGVELTHLALENRAREERRERGDWDGMLGNKTDLTGAADPYETFHSAGAANHAGLADAALDALLERARTTLDPEQRRAIYREVHQRIAELEPAAFLVHPRAAMLVNAHFQDAEPGPLGMWPERFWVPRAFQRDR